VVAIGGRIIEVEPIGWVGLGVDGAQVMAAAIPRPAMIDGTMTIMARVPSWCI